MFSSENIVLYSQANYRPKSLLTGANLKRKTCYAGTQSTLFIELGKSLNINFLKILLKLIQSERVTGKDSLNTYGKNSLNSYLNCPNVPRYKERMQRLEIASISI